MARRDVIKLKQGVVLAGRNRTGPPCSVGHQTTHVPGRRAPTVHAAGERADRRHRSHAAFARSQQSARPPAALQTTTTDASKQNNTGLLGGPVIMCQ